MGFNLAQVTLGQQALSAQVMNLLFQLRQNLEIEERNDMKDANKVLAQSAEYNAEYSKESTIKQADSQKKGALGDIFGSIGEVAGTAYGLKKAQNLNDEAATLRKQVSAKNTDIETEKTKLGVMPANGDAPQNGVAGPVENQDTVQKNIDRLTKERDNAEQEAQRHEQNAYAVRQQYSTMAQAMSNGVKGGFNLAASQSTADKAKYDAAIVIFNFSQTILGKIFDALGSMAQSQDSSVQSLAQMLAALTSSNRYAA